MGYGYAEPQDQISILSKEELRKKLKNLHKRIQIERETHAWLKNIYEFPLIFLIISVFLFACASGWFVITIHDATENRTIGNILGFMTCLFMMFFLATLLPVLRLCGITSYHSIQKRDYANLIHKIEYLQTKEINEEKWTLRINAIEETFQELKSKFILTHEESIRRYYTNK
jgi:hypothetical protein